MKLSTCLLTTLSPPDGEAEAGVDAAIVIDVLRATSVMTTALHHGAAQIVTCREVAEARDLATEMQPTPLLCGERGCQPIEGFDLGNSPTEYTPDRVRGMSLILTTTNGTRAIERVAEVPRVAVASFLNLSAVVKWASSASRVELVCAGTEGRITLEDVLLAGAILWECHRLYEAQWIDDDSVLALQLWRSWFPKEAADGRMPNPRSLSDHLRETRGGRNLTRLAYDADLDRCALIDSINLVPQRSSRSPMTFGRS